MDGWRRDMMNAGPIYLVYTSEKLQRRESESESRDLFSHIRGERWVNQWKHITLWFHRREELFLSFQHLLIFLRDLFMKSRTRKGFFIFSFFFLFWKEKERKKKTWFLNADSGWKHFPLELFKTDEREARRRGARFVRPSCRIPIKNNDTRWEMLRFEMFRWKLLDVSQKCRENKWKEKKKSFDRTQKVLVKLWRTGRQKSNGGLFFGFRWFIVDVCLFLLYFFLYIYIFHFWGIKMTRLSSISCWCGTCEPSWYIFFLFCMQC